MTIFSLARRPDKILTGYSDYPRSCCWRFFLSLHDFFEWLTWWNFDKNKKKIWKNSLCLAHVSTKVLTAFSLRMNCTFMLMTIGWLDFQPASKFICSVLHTHFFSISKWNTIFDFCSRIWSLLLVHSFAYTRPLVYFFTQPYSYLEQ